MTGNVKWITERVGAVLFLGSLSLVLTAWI